MKDSQLYKNRIKHLNKSYYPIGYIASACVITAALGYMAALYRPFPWLELIVFKYPISNEDKISLLTLISVVVGGSWALYQYRRNMQKAKNDFVKISVVAEHVNGAIHILTKIDNPVNENKHIKAAFLILSRTDDNFVQKCNDFMNYTDLKETNDLIVLADREKIFGCHFGFIPLTYYSSENVRVGNEELSYTYILANHDRAKICSGEYSVRFFVFSQNGHYHRCVQAAFHLDRLTNSHPEDCDCSETRANTQNSPNAKKENKAY